MNWQKTTQQAWKDELVSGNYDVFGTLKFAEKKRVGAATAEKLWSAYWHKVDWVCFGQAASKGYGVERWCFEEWGEYDEKLHLHFVARAPFDTMAFCAVLNALWATSSKKAAPLHDNWITPIVDVQKAAGYTIKDTRRFSLGTAGLKCSHRNTRAPSSNPSHLPQQAKRIQKTIPIDTFEQAYLALNWQISKSQARIQRRNRQQAA
jgi:hypothetical protein